MGYGRKERRKLTGKRRRGEGQGMGRHNLLWLLLLPVFSLFGFAGWYANRSFREEGIMSGAADGDEVLPEYEIKKRELGLFSGLPFHSIPSAWWQKTFADSWQPHDGVRQLHLWHKPPYPTTGFVLVRCNGGLNQQRSAICNAVVVARIMNATLVLPQLDTNDYWNDTSGFPDIYDASHFISTLSSDVHIVRNLPPKVANDRSQIRRVRPPRDAPLEYYSHSALKSLKKVSAVYFTPFAHRLAEELGTSPEALELQRLRCRANFEALRFTPRVEEMADVIVKRLRRKGPFIAVHLRFEMDMLAFAGCLDIFNEEEQALLAEYRRMHFAEKELKSAKRRRMGKCPLTPEEVGLLLKAMGFPPNTTLYIASGRMFGGDRFMAPLRALFPSIQNRTSVLSSSEREGFDDEGKGLLSQAVDYTVCAKADLFIPSYDGPSNFANIVMGHRLYSGYLPTIRPDRKVIARLLDERANGELSDDVFANTVQEAMRRHAFASVHERKLQEPFYANPWPECFCKQHGKKLNKEHKCPKTGHHKG